jgi:ribosomal protein S18 acetylase RimI-like enzyme
MGWITTICVLPQYQNQGMGSALLAACENQMRQPVVRLSVRTSNLGAIRLYQHKGYRQVDVWRQYYMDHEDALVLEKHISAGL